MFLGQIKFVLGPGWQAKIKIKKWMSFNFQMFHSFTTVCKRLTITPSQETAVVVLLAIFQVYFIWPRIASHVITSNFFGLTFGKNWPARSEKRIGMAHAQGAMVLTWFYSMLANWVSVIQSASQQRNVTRVPTRLDGLFGTIWMLCV